MIRRAFIGWGLGLVGFGRRVLGSQRVSPDGVGAAAQLADAPRYARLSQAIRIPLEAVAVPWQPAAFTAEAMAAATATSAGRRVLISGVLFRKGSSEQLCALCLTCPHEQCKVDLITEPDRLARMTDGTTTHPLFECGCHSSVFDPQEDGARVSGETPRGLYRFRITSVSDSVVEVNEIEEVALSEV